MACVLSTANFLQENSLQLFSGLRYGPVHLARIHQFAGSGTGECNLAADKVLPCLCLSKWWNRGHTSYMTQAHFMEYLRFFIGTLNRIRQDHAPRGEKLSRLNHLLGELRKLADSLLDA